MRFFEFFMRIYLEGITYLELYSADVLGYFSKLIEVNKFINW